MLLRTNRVYMLHTIVYRSHIVNKKGYSIESTTITFRNKI